MAEDLRQNPAVQAELDIIAYLESKRGKYIVPADPHELSFGTYHLNAMGLVDAVQNGVEVPAKVRELVGDWEGKSTSDRFQTQQSLFGWMKDNLQDTDHVAEQYYASVVRPRAKNSGPAAIMSWQAPGATSKDLSDLGIKAEDLSSNPRELSRFLDHIEGGNNSDRATRVKDLRNVLPLLDYTKTIAPPDVKTAPVAPRPSGPPRPIEQFDPRIPYPTTDVTDPWMQHGHAVVYQESIKDYGDILGQQTVQAAVQLRTKLDQDSASRRLLSRSYGTEALEPASGPIELGLEVGSLPYGMFRATTDIIQGQLEGDMSFTERLQNGMWAAPLIVGSIFSHKSLAASRVKLRGMTEDATAAKVTEAKDNYTKQLDDIQSEREDIEAHIRKLEAADKTGADDPGAVTSRLNEGKELRRQLQELKKKERFIGVILDNDKGQSEIIRLEGWLHDLREELSVTDVTASKTKLPSQIKLVEKQLEAAKKRLQDAQDALKLPTSDAFRKAVEVHENLVKSADMPNEAAQLAASKLIEEGKVSIDTILARGLDAPLNPIEQLAELKLMQTGTNELKELRDAYAKSNGGIVEANQYMRTLATMTAALGKVRRSQVRSGQATELLRGKSYELRALENVVEGLDQHTLPAFSQIWDTATTDTARFGQLRRLANPGVLKGATLQILTNNLISSLSTPIWNTISMGAMTLSRINELRMLGKLDPTHYASDEAGTFASALVNYYGRVIVGDARARAAWSEQFQKASLRSADIDPGIMEKYNFRTSVSAKTLGMTGFWGRAVDRLGYTINLPTQMSAWADAFVSVGVKDAMVKTVAHRQATLELQAELKFGAELTQKQIQSRIALREQEIMSNPNAMITVDGRAVLIRDIANEEAAVISMMGKLQSQALAGVEKWANNSLLARMVIPFWHPFLQTGEMALERTPIGRLLPHMQADLAAGGARAAAAKAKLATGNQTAALFAMFAGASYIAGNGDVDSSDWVGFTGSGPFREAQKSLWAATHRADTIRVGGKEFALAKLGPVGQVMSATADAMGVINELINIGDKSATDKAVEIAAHVSAMTTSLVVSELFADDVKEIIQGVIEGSADALQRVVERKAGMMVPAGAFMRDISNILSNTRHVLQTAIGPMKFVVPLNFWGDPTRYYGTQNPFFTVVGMTERNAPDFDRKNAVTNRLIRDDVAITAPPKTLAYDGVTLELSLEQMYAMRKYFAKEKLPTPDGQDDDLLGGLEQMITNPLYSKLVNGSGEDADYHSRFNVGSKQDYINMYVSKRKEAAAKWLLGESPWAEELQQRLIMTKQSREYNLNNPQGTLPAQEPNNVGVMTSPFSFGGLR